MKLRRLGFAALLAAVTAGPAAANPAGADPAGADPAAADPPGENLEPPAQQRPEARDPKPAPLRDILGSLGEAAGKSIAIAQTGAPRQGPVFSRPGDWAHAEAAVVIGTQLVNQDLGFSRNIFQTVSAEAEDVGFGEHYGARGAFFVNRYLGAEAGFARTTTEFEFLVTDDEAGVTIFEEALVQVSQEASIAAVAQWPRAAITPYAVAGYAWRTSEIAGGDPFQSGALVMGFGIKVPFPRIPVSLAFDYRYVQYGDGEDNVLQLAEGGMGSPTVSALTLGVVVRLNVNR